jgi:arylsulfatase A-like enzyme
VDLLPTVVDLLEVPDPMNRMGRSLVPLMAARAEAAPSPIVAATFRPEASADLQAVVVGGHKLILAPDSDAVELYDLAEDPAENTNLAS